LTTSTLVGGLLVAVGCLDALVGLLVVVPRTPERSRPALRLAFVAGSAILIALGGAFLAGFLGTRS